MPNRILRDWTDSAAIDKLTYQEEVLFTRLIMKADDFGNFYRNPVLIRSLVFPRKDGLRSADIDRWLTSLEAADLIRTYPAKGDTFLHIVNFGQRLRQTRRMFPEPPESILSATCQQHDSNSPPETKRSRNEVETETEAAQAPDDRFSKKLELVNPFSEKFLETWVIWKDYKKKEFRFLFKSIESEQAALNELVNLSQGDEETAKKIVVQSMAKGWKGFFALKNEANESSSSKTQSKSTVKGTSAGLNSVFAKRYGERTA